jgi:hypothetical protein
MRRALDARRVSFEVPGSMTSFRAARAITAALAIAGCSRMQLRSPIAPIPVVVPPATFVQTTSDVKATRVIDVREGLTKAALFKAATDLLTQASSVDVSDPRAGFLMTPWQAGTTRDGAPELRYRTRIVIRFLGDEWKQVTVRAEANWQRMDEWDIGYDSKLLEDVSSDLRARIGRKL